MSRRNGSGGGITVIIGIVFLIFACVVAAAIVYYALQNRQGNTTTEIPATIPVAQLPTAEPTNPLLATNTPAATPEREAIVTVDTESSSIFLTETAVAAEQREEEEQVFLTQTRPFIPTNTPRPTNTAVVVATTAPLATQTPIATTIPTQGPTNAWEGAYFANQDLLDPPQYYRQEQFINFDWGTGSPGNGLPNDNFSVRWERVIAMSPGNYRFYVRADDGVRVWLNNQLIINRWEDATDLTYTADQTISQANNAFRVEYFENIGDAQIQFWWEKIGDFPEWQGQYYSNATLNESGLALTRNDTAINFDWGEGSPANGLPVDNFSARWRRTINFNADRYRFFAEMDDGVRIYVDGKLVVEDWEAGGVRIVSGATNISQGEHIVIIEYFENVAAASIRVWWEKDVPTATPTPAPTATATVAPPP